MPEYRVVKRRLVSSDRIPEFTYIVQMKRSGCHWQDVQAWHQLDGAIRILQSMQTPDEQVYP